MDGSAQSRRMAAGAPGLEEAGAPLFTVVSREAIGLSSSPTDLKVLPDGRLLLVAGRGLAFGDGTRWEVYAQDPAQEAARALTVGIDDVGTIYQSIDRSFSRVDFGRDGFWRLIEVAPWPDMGAGENPAPRHVIAVGDTWYWHASSGMILAWRPGQSARAVRAATTVETIFRLQGIDYLSDRNTPSIEQLTDGPEPGLLRTANRSAPELITCVLPLPDGRALAGTTGRGVLVIDDSVLHPLAPYSAIGSGRHIRDLCALAPGLFAAAIEDEGSSSSTTKAVSGRLCRAPWITGSPASAGSCPAGAVCSGGS